MGLGPHRVGVDERTGTRGSGPIPWVVTREAADAAELLERLAARGQAALCVPAIARQRLPWPEAYRLPPAPGTWLLVTSPFSADTVRAAVGHHASLLRWAALAPATSACLARAGVAIELSARGGVVALARAAARAGVAGPVWFPTSDAGLAEEEQAEALALLGPRAQVIRAAVYTTAPHPELDGRLRALSDWRAVVFSPSAARAMLDALARGAPPPRQVVAVGRSTARVLGGRAMLAPPELDLTDFLCTLGEPA